MKRLKITELRGNLFEIAEEVVEQHEPIVLTRRGKKSLVLISEEEWMGVQEKAAKYESKAMSGSKRSMVGSLILKTRDLEGDIRKIRDEFARALNKSSLKDK